MPLKGKDDDYCENVPVLAEVSHLALPPSQLLWEVLPIASA